MLTAYNTISGTGYIHRCINQPKNVEVKVTEPAVELPLVLDHYVKLSRFAIIYVEFNEPEFPLSNLYYAHFRTRI